MYNLVYLIGRLTENPETVKKENGEKALTVNLAVQRPYKDAQGEYGTDFVECTLMNNIAQNTADFCRKGDLIAIRGQIKTSPYDDKEKQKKYKTEIIVEKISFLATKDRKSMEKDDSMQKDDI